MASPRRPITVTVPHDRAAAVDVIGHRVQRHVEALFAELELGPAPAVELGVGEPPGLAIEQRVVPLVLPAGGDPIALGELVAVAIHRCRELLISDALVDGLWRAWFPGGAGDARPAEALPLVRTAVRYGLRSSRCKPALAQTSLAREPPERFVERVIGELLDDEAAGSVELRLGGALHAALLAAPAADGPPLAALGDELYRALGIVVRFAPIALDPGLAGDEVAIRCNDLSTPAVRVGATGQVAPLLASVLREAAGSFVSQSLVRLYLLRLAASSEALVDEVERRFSTGQLAGVLRALVDEQVSILDLRGILEAMLEVAGTASIDDSRFIAFLPSSTQLFPARERLGPGELDAAAYAECARAARKRALTWHHAREMSQLLVYLAAPEVERVLATPGGMALADQLRVCAAIQAALAGGVLGQRAVLLTTMEVRRRLAELVRGVFPEVTVTSYAELAADANIVTLGRITLPP